MTIPAILDRHAEEAALLWIQRDGAVVAPHYNLRSLTELDERIEAHLDGLRIAGDAGRQRVWREFEEHPEPGEAFAAAVLAFESADAGQIASLLAQVAGQDALVRPLISALGWLSPESAGVAIPLLLSWGDPVSLHVGLGGAAVRREHPGGKVLLKALQHADASIRARAFRACGELGDRSQVQDLFIGQADADADCRFWATWSVALLTADPSALAELREEIGPRARITLQLAARRGEPAQFRGWLRGRLNNPDRRTSIIAAGAFGEADTVPWLLDQLGDPALARLAGESISDITGIDPNAARFEGSPPTGHADGPTDDPADEDVAPDPDADLPWPNVKALRDWWGAHRGDFPTQTRLLAGRPITPEWLRQVLMQGSQRHRTAAALEQVKLRPGEPLVETRARVRHQTIQGQSSP